MTDRRTIEEKSFQHNMDLFLDPLEHLEIYQLSRYLCESFMDTPANDIQVKFVDEFMGTDDWVNFIQSQKKPNSFFHMRPAFDLLQIRDYLNYKITHRFIDVLTSETNMYGTITKLKLGTLEVMVKFDGPDYYDKVDGFSDLRDMLVENKILDENL